MKRESMSPPHNPAPNRHASATWQASGALKDYWYVACTSSELRMGKPLPVTMFGVGIVLFRQQGNRVSALLDQCLHRGTRLSAGKLQDGCLTCPYHGWRYDGSGHVVHIPTVDGAEQPAQAHGHMQKSFPACERDGLVWVYPGETGKAGVPPFAMPFFDDPNWVCYYMVNIFDGEVGALAQNFMDVPHTVFVHPGIFRSSARTIMQTTVETKAASVEVSYHDNEDKVGMLPWLTNPQGAPLMHTDEFFAPNVTRCDYHWGDATGFVITSQMTPMGGQRCRVYTCISYKFRLPRLLSRLLRPLIHLYTWIVIQQDIRIMRFNRQGLNNSKDFKPHSVQADFANMAIERMIDACRDGQDLPGSVLGSRPMNFKL